MPGSTSRITFLAILPRIWSRQATLRQRPEFYAARSGNARGGPRRRPGGEPTRPFRSGRSAAAAEARNFAGRRCQAGWNAWPQPSASGLRPPAAVGPDGSGPARSAGDGRRGCGGNFALPGNDRLVARQAAGDMAPVRAEVRLHVRDLCRRGTQVGTDCFDQFAEKGGPIRPASLRSVTEAFIQPSAASPAAYVS